MLSDRKLLVTGLTGQIGHPVARILAADNEVWGAARFTADGSRQRAESIGVTPVTVDLETGDYGDLPDDFTHVVHLAVWMGPKPDHDRAVRANAEATGLLMQHCRRAEGFLVASTNSVYRANGDPNHQYAEGDPLGDPAMPFSPTYSMSKNAQEAVARTMARALGLRTTIARINASYGPNGGLPAYHGDAVAAGQTVHLRAPGPNAYSPIHEDDLATQVMPLLDAAATPATIVNWCGDDRPGLRRRPRRPTRQCRRPDPPPRPHRAVHGALAGGHDRHARRPHEGSLTTMDADDLADRIAIGDLLTRYATAVDRRDWDLYRTVFTEDAHIDYTSAGGIAGGLDDIVAYLAQVMPMFEMSQHLVANLDVALDGDTATVTAMFSNPMRLVDGDVWFTGGWYHHDLVRTADGWRSRRLLEEAAWFDRAPF